VFEVDPLKIIPEGRYEISHALGRGAFGTVYRGRRLATGDDVVLKFLHLPNAEAVARIDREIAVLKAIPHDQHVVSFDDGFLSPDASSAVLVSEWIDGPSVQSLVEAHAQGLPTRVTVAIARQLCAGLSHLHQYHIIHRDIKPSNVLISKDGVVKLVDFGLAIGASAGTLSSGITTVGSFVGTLRYAAPEMVMGQLFSSASDVYALGVTILFMILGRPPLPEATVPYLLREISRGAVLADLPESQKAAWGAILSPTLDIQPEKRPSTMQLHSVLSEAFPLTAQDDTTVVAEFIREAGALRPPPPQPPRVVTSAPEPEGDDSLPNLVRALASRIAKVQSAVADLTASFARGDLPSQQVSANVPSAVGPEQKVEVAFDAIRRRLGLTWRFSLGMTFILFSTFVTMIVLAIVFGLVYHKSFWSILFGGTSVLSLLTVVVWRPMDKMLFTTIATQQLELIQINYQRALSGTREERSEAFREVSAQLDSLLAKVTSSSGRK
jgi:serine/threonine protein kinase